MNGFLDFKTKYLASATFFFSFALFMLGWATKYLTDVGNGRKSKASKQQGTVLESTL